MKILKYKKRPNGRYSLYLDDGRELILYEDVILKHELIIRREILEKDLIDIEKDNIKYDVYYVALKSINSRYKSVYELEEFLRKKEYPNDSIQYAISELTKQGYLNDRNFAKSYINSQMITTNHGPNRIKNDLINKHIDMNIILEEIESFSEEEQKEKIEKAINARLKSNHTRGGVVLKNKITNDLLLLGYDLSMIQHVLSHFNFSNNQDLAKKEYEKLYKKYSHKYSGLELQRKIKEKLYLKGLSYEEE